MSNNVVPLPIGKVSRVFANQTVQDDLSAGIAASFGIIGYKGKVWSIRYRGENKPIMRPDNDGPANSIEVVILKSAPVVSKIWYEGQYVEGNTDAPDCFSINGKVPELTSKKRQAEACAICPRNVWGSKTTENGKAGKECTDNKRLAVVPLNNILNEELGGPMLLRVPAASLQELATFGATMHQHGFPYYSVGVKISFDTDVAYPRFKFHAVRPLTDEEAQLVVATQQSVLVERILNGGEMAGAPQSPGVVQEGPFLQAPQGGPSSVFQTAQTAGAAAQPTPKPTSPGTGAAPSTSAQPAVSPSTQGITAFHGPATEPTEQAKSVGSASPAQSHQKTKKISQASSNGFGHSVPEMNGTSKEENTSPAFATKEATGSENEDEGDDFTASLDAQLKNLLPS